MLEAVPELSDAEIVVIARYPFMRDGPQLGRLISRRHTNRSSIIADLGSELLYLSHRCDSTQHTDMTT
jgi:hypothetical protein